MTLLEAFEQTKRKWEWIKEDIKENNPDWWFGGIAILLTASIVCWICVGLIILTN